MQVITVLLRRHAAVRVHHDDDVAGGGQKPVRNALPLPAPCCGTIRTSGRHRRAVSSVTSVDYRRRMISATSPVICSRTQAMLRASFLTGITRLTVECGTSMVAGGSESRESDVRRVVPGVAPTRRMPIRSRLTMKQWSCSAADLEVEVLRDSQPGVRKTLLKMRPDHVLVARRSAGNLKAVESSAC